MAADYTGTNMICGAFAGLGLAQRLASGLVALAVSTSWTGSAASAAVPLWEIGRPDGSDREFALAPGRYAEFRDDALFVPGRSEAGRDWPYVHPGPADAWAGGRSHTFAILFGLEKVPAPGECRLRLKLLDTHQAAPPELRIRINGRESRHRLPSGAGDASVFGDPTRGRNRELTVPFGSDLLRAGANEVTLTTASGSWFLYDWLALEAPEGGVLTGVEGTVLSGLRSAPVLVERAGALHQVIEVSVRHLGDPASGRLLGGGAPGVDVALRTGTQTVDLSVPAVQQETPVEVRLEVAGREVATAALTLRPVRRWVVYLLPHSHVDIGYTHVQTDVEQAQWKYLDMAMAAARRTANYPEGARFKWNVEVLWAVDSYLRQATPGKRQEFFDAVRAGQVGLQALYGNQLTGLCHPEELLRLLGFAQRLARETGRPVESAMITDVPGYTWGIVPALAHSGVKYFSIGPNGGDRIGWTTAAWGDKPFWWKGPNGKDRVLVWMTGTGYYQVFQSASRLLDYLDQLAENGYPYDAVQVRHCLGDNGAPDVDFADKVREWNQTHAFPRLVIATTEDMFHEFERRYGDRLPEAQGDFTPYWEDGAASSARETALNRATADRLVQAEALFALVNPQGYPAEAFDRAWRNVLLYNEHTWGAHNSISQPDQPFVKSQWSIKQAFALEADRQSRALIEQANAGRGDPVAAATPDGERLDVVDVFNTTAESIPYALVTIPKELSGAGDCVWASPTNRGSRISQRLTSGDLVFRACWGQWHAHRFHIGPGPENTNVPDWAATVEGLTLRTRELSLRLDERTGAIASLRSLRPNAEWVDTNAAFSLNEYFYLPGSDLDGLQRAGPVRITPRERGPLIASLLVEGEAPGCRRLTREVRIHAVRPCVEIIDTVDKLPIRAKEGVHFGFAFNVPDGIMRVDVPWGVVRVEQDQIPGACKNWLTLQRWVDISCHDRGLTWLSPDAPLLEVGGITANLIGSQSDPRAWRDRIEPSQTLYSWAMNNHWHTNYRAEQEGPTVFRYCLIPHAGGFNGAVSARLGLEWSQPLLALRARGSVPTQGPLRSVRPEKEGAVVTALKPSVDGKALILRLFGASGTPTRFDLDWQEPIPQSVWLSDNSEQPRRKLEGATVEVPAFGLVTLRAERQER